MARLRSYDYESETVGLWKHHEHEIILSFLDVLSEFVETHEVYATLSSGEFKYSLKESCNTPIRKFEYIKCESNKRLKQKKQKIGCIYTMNCIHYMCSEK